MPHWRNVSSKPKARLSSNGKLNGLCPPEAGTWAVFWSGPERSRNIDGGRWSFRGHIFACDCAQFNHYYVTDSRVATHGNQWGRDPRDLISCNPEASILSNIRRID